MATNVGFYTDTTVCIGCKACQVACHQWNNLPAGSGPTQPDGFRKELPVLSGNSYDNTQQPVRRELAARQVHRAVQSRPEPFAGGLADDVRRLQALRQRAVPGGLPDRAPSSAPSSTPSTSTRRPATAAATASRPAPSASST